MKITFAGQKGGTGKTTCGINFASEAAYHGHNTTIIDLDPQASAAFWGDLRGIDKPRVISGHASRLKQMVSEAEDSGSSLIVIDTPPSVESGIYEAAEISDLVVMPSLPVLIEIRALLPTVNIIRTTHTPAKVLFNRVDARTSLLTEGQKAIKHYKLESFPCHIINRIAFAHAYNNGQSVREYEPSGKAVREIQAFYRYIEKELGV